MEQPKKLSKKHLNFIEHYFINGFNATKAYMEAYPKASEKSASEAASRLLQRDEVAAEIKARQAELSEKNEIKRDKIVTDLNELILNCKAKGDRRNLLGALNLLCKMSGQFAPQKMDVQTSYKVSFGGAASMEEDKGEE